MPYNISIKLHPIPSTFFMFVVATAPFWYFKPQNYEYTCQTKFMESFIQFMEIAKTLNLTQRWIRTFWGLYISN
jgi:hypothetical protein